MRSIDSSLVLDQRVLRRVQRTLRVKHIEEVGQTFGVPCHRDAGGFPVLLDLLFQRGLALPRQGSD